MAAAVAASSSSVVAAASSAAPAVACCAVCSATAESLERRTPPCLLLTAKCGHSTICEDCLPRKFEFLDSKFRGVIQCTSCGTDLRDSDYSSKTPEELQVEHALQVRRKVKKECAPPASRCQRPSSRPRSRSSSRSRRHSCHRRCRRSSSRFRRHSCCRCRRRSSSKAPFVECLTDARHRPAASTACCQTSTRRARSTTTWRR